MSRSIRLSVPEPCHEGWDKMTPNEKGRFCQSCQKTVVDFTQMSDKQIIEHLSKSSSNTCGHFYLDQLERSLVEGKEPKISWWKKGWNAVAASLLLSTVSYAQGNVKAKKTMTRTIAEGMKPGQFIAIDGMITPKFDLAGTVVDAETLLPIKGVAISIGDSLGSTLSDSAGLFLAKSLPTQDVVEMKFCADGYKPTKIPVSLLDMSSGISIFGKRDEQEYGPFTIYLEREYINADTVSPTCTTPSDEYLTRGVTIVDYEETMSSYKKFLNDSIMRMIADTLSIFSRFKVYPNPARVGTFINVQFTPNNAGPFKVELFNPIGQLVRSEQVSLAAGKQIMKIPLESNLIKGMYIVRIRHNDSKKQYTKKILVN